jgi:hypothetical protein
VVSPKITLKLHDQLQNFKYNLSQTCFRADMRKIKQKERGKVK